MDILDLVGPLHAEAQAQLRERLEGKLATYFPATGAYRRECYPKHLLFFRAGAVYRQRALIAANRVGKSDAGCYELALHLTGEYPDWWEGHRFDHPIDAWACGDTSKTARDILQAKLLGRTGEPGTGFLPSHLILGRSARAGVPEAIESVRVQHKGGGISNLQFRSYDARREAFQGTAQHLILLDEEPPSDIHSECLLRTMKTSDFPGGLLMLTFTPLLGLTELVQDFLKASTDPEQKRLFAVTATWDDVPHLTDEEKTELHASIPPYQRDARTKGIPVLGAGRIYPVAEEEVAINDFELPAHWPRGFALDAQALWKSSVHAAWDRQADIYYIYSVWQREQVEPAVHADALRGLGLWIPGVGDAAGLVQDADRQRYIDVYQRFGVDLTLATKGVEPGIQETYVRLSSGRLRVFRSCQAWFEEYRLYRRNDRGQVVKEKDHLMDATRYLCMGHIARGANWMKTSPARRRQVDQKRRAPFAHRAGTVTTGARGWTK